MGPDEILRRYVLSHEKESILVEVHVRIPRGHYGGRATAIKILQAGLWWPTMHNDVTYYAKSYDVFQRKGKPSR